MLGLGLIEQSRSGGGLNLLEEAYFCQYAGRRNFLKNLLVLGKGSAVSLAMHNAVAVYPLLVSKNEELTHETH